MNVFEQTLTVGLLVSSGGSPPSSTIISVDGPAAELEEHLTMLVEEKVARARVPAPRRRPPI